MIVLFWQAGASPWKKFQRDYPARRADFRLRQYDKERRRLAQEAQPPTQLAKVRSAGRAFTLRQQVSVEQKNNCFQPPAHDGYDLKQKDWPVYFAFSLVLLEDFCVVFLAVFIVLSFQRGFNAGPVFACSARISPALPNLIVSASTTRPMY